MTGQPDDSPAGTQPGHASKRSAILLAAGASTRMGRAKALLPWAGATLVQYSLAQLRDAGTAVTVVVLGGNAEEVQATLPPPAPNLVIVINEHYLEGGRSSSIRAGAAKLPPGAHPIVIQSIDQPCPASVLQVLYEVLEDNLSASHLAIAIPTHQGRSGHPICISGELTGELMSVTEREQGLRAILRHHPDRIARVPVSSSAVLLNLNDPVAYNAAYAAHGWE